MEVTLCAQEVSNHAVLLLAHLNLQRKEDWFCDCVLRHRDHPSQVHPAHRCVVAASSPVLASLLSSTGVLVELQAPCFSDSILAAVLDYMYTGTLPNTQSQQQYNCLLSAACHLQMDELREALENWLQTEGIPADNASSNSTEDENQPLTDNIAGKKASTTFRNVLLLTPSNKAFRRPEEIDASRHQSTAASLESEAQKYSSHSKSFHEVEVKSVGGSSRKDEEIDASRNADENVASPWNKTDAGTLSSAHDSRKRAHWKSLSLIQTISSPAEGHGISGEKKDEQMAQFQSVSIVKSEKRMKHLEETQVRLTEARRSSPSLPHACYEPVSVIRHCRRGTIFKCPEMSAVPPSVSQAFLVSSRVQIPQTASTYNDRTAGGITSEYKNPYASQNQNVKGQTVMQCQEPLQSSTKHFREDTVQQETDPIFGDLPSKYRKRKCFESYSASMGTTTEEQSQDLRNAFPLPRKDSNSGSETQNEDFCPEEDVMKEHSYSSSCLGETDAQDNQSNVYGQQTNWLSNIWRTESSLNYAPFTQQEQESDKTQTDVDNRGHTNMSTPGLSGYTIAGHPSSFECPTALETEKMSESTEPHLSFTISVDRPMSDTTVSDVDETYCGHHHDQRLSEENTFFSCGGHEHKRFQTGLHHSDEDEEEVGANTKSGPDPQGEHLATDTTDQVLLLDISTKRAQLLVSCRRTSDTDQMDISDTGQMNAEGVNQSRPGVQVIEKAESVELIFKEGENQTSTQTVGSPLSVSDSSQASSSVCLPFTLSTSIPTNISTHLSTLVKHPFQCSLCDRSFSQRGSLNRHLRSHLGVRPFPCPYCPMTFSRQYRVSEHVRVHQRYIVGNIFPKNPTTTV